LKSGKNCENEIRLLLREANVADDWSVDPILRKNCQVCGFSRTLFNTYFQESLLFT
jgi:AraC-like DNA-binding protein